MNFLGLWGEADDPYSEGRQQAYPTLGAAKADLEQYAYAVILDRPDLLVAGDPLPLWDAIWSWCASRGWKDVSGLIIGGMAWDDVNEVLWT